MRRAEGGANIFGVFRVKNHDFTPKNHIFSNFRGGGRRVRPLDTPLIRATPVMGTEMFVLEHLIEAEIKRDIRMPVCLIKVANTISFYSYGTRTHHTRANTLTITPPIWFQCKLKAVY